MLSLVFVYRSELEFGFAALVFLQRGPEGARLEVWNVLCHEGFTHGPNLHVVIFGHAPQVRVTSKYERVAGVELQSCKGGEKIFLKTWGQINLSTGQAKVAQSITNHGAGMGVDILY